MAPQPPSSSTRTRSQAQYLAQKCAQLLYYAARRGSWKVSCPRQLDAAFVLSIATTKGRLSGRLAPLATTSGTDLKRFMVPFLTQKPRQNPMIEGIKGSAAPKTSPSHRRQSISVVMGVNLYAFFAIHDAARTRGNRLPELQLRRFSIASIGLDRLG